MVRVVAGIAPDRVEAPDLRAVCALKSQGRKRDGDLDGIAPARDSAGRIPDGIPPGVFSRLGFDLIELDALRRYDEVETSTLIVERVQDQRDPIISAEGVAIAQMGSDRGRLRVVAAKRRVETVVIIREKDLGADGRGHVLPGPNLVVQLEAQRSLPGLLIEDPIDRYPGCRPWNTERFLERLRCGILPRRDLC
jgi:hypothetical protein